jgi:hypothetical protein
MVRVYGANLSDVTDRSARQLGLVYGMRLRDGTWCYPHIAWNDHINTQPSPWWVHYPWGRMLVLDDFEGTLLWTQNSGTVSKANDARFVHSGSYALKMVTGTTEGSQAEAQLRCQPIDRWGTYATLGFFWDAYAGYDYTVRDFYVKWVVDDLNSNREITFGIRYHNWESTTEYHNLQYWDSTGAWADLSGTTQKISSTTPQFNMLVLAIKKDATAGYAYYMVQMNEVGRYLNLAGGQQGTLGIPGQTVKLGCTTNSPDATTAYVDDFWLMDDTLAHFWTAYGGV